MAYRIMIVSLFVILYSSCTTSKKITYFNNTVDSTFQSMSNNFDPVFRSNDLLNISISSLNKVASEEFNINAQNANLNGYLIDNEGNIVMPTLGTIKAAGFTKKQLAEKISTLIVERKLLLEPIVRVRLLNFDVTVIGEVNNPTVLNVPNESISLIKALALAGDLTIYGKRDNILLIREEEGKKITRHININNEDFFKSPYYYLKPNDIVYVEPNKAKISSAGASKTVLPIVLTALPFLILIFDKVIK